MARSASAPSLASGGIGHISSSATGSVAIPSGSDGNNATRERALRSLREPLASGEAWGDARRCMAASLLLKDGDDAARRFALYAFMSIGPAGAPHAAAIVGLLGDEDWGTRRAALSALEAMGPAASNQADAVALFLTNQDADVRCGALDVLRSMGPQAA